SRCRRSATRRGCRPHRRERREPAGAAPSRPCPLASVVGGRHGCVVTMRFWRRRRALVCRQAVALMTDYLDGQLAPRDLERLEAPLAACPHCSEYLAQLRV